MSEAARNWSPGRESGNPSRILKDGAGGPRLAPVSPGRRRRGPLVLLAVVLLLALISALLLLPGIERVIIRSDLDITESEVRSIIGLRSGEPLLLYDLDRAARRLESLAPVAQANLGLRFPDTLIVELQARQPLVSVLVPDSRGSRLYAMDRTGMVFSPASRMQLRELPLLSGGMLRRVAPGRGADPMLLPVLDSLSALQDQAPEVLLSFSEFRVDPVAGGAVEVVAYPLSLPVAFRLEGRFTHESLRTGLLAAQSMRLPAGQLLDLRSGGIVLRSGEASR